MANVLYLRLVVDVLQYRHERILIILFAAAFCRMSVTVMSLYTLPFHDINTELEHFPGSVGSRLAPVAMRAADGRPRPKHCATYANAETVLGYLSES